MSPKFVLTVFPLMSRPWGAAPRCFSLPPRSNIVQISASLSCLDIFFGINENIKTNPGIIVIMPTESVQNVCHIYTRPKAVFNTRCHWLGPCKPHLTSRASSRLSIKTVYGSPTLARWSNYTFNGYQTRLCNSLPTTPRGPSAGLVNCQDGRQAAGEAKNQWFLRT